MLLWQGSLCIYGKEANLCLRTGHMVISGGGLALLEQRRDRLQVLLQLLAL